MVSFVTALTSLTWLESQNISLRLLLSRSCRLATPLLIGTTGSMRLLQRSTVDDI
jgi:hypothetical protein